MRPNSNGSITTSTAGTSVNGLTPGSYVVASLDQSVYNVGLNIDGSWSATISGFFSPDFVNLIPISNSNFYNTLTGSAGIASGATGQFNLPVSGKGWLFVVATAYSSGPININLTLGSGSIS